MEKNITSKNEGSEIINWLMWWEIGANELKKQVEEYRSLPFYRSARGISMLLLILSAVKDAAYILLTNALGYQTFIFVAIALFLAYFVYRGHRPAMVFAMFFWTAIRILSLAQINLVISFIWWVIYMHAFYLAFRTEVERRKKSALPENS